MGKKSRRDKKQGQGSDVPKLKTREERQQQVAILSKKLMDIQLDERQPEIQELLVKMNRYVETGQSLTGKLPLSNSNKVIKFILSNRRQVDCQVSIVVTS